MRKQREKEEADKKAGTPYLTNLNEDEQLNRKVFYYIKEDEPVTVGKRSNQN